MDMPVLPTQPRPETFWVILYHHMHLIFALTDFPDVIKSEEVCPYILETLITGVVEQAVEKKHS